MLRFILNRIILVIPTFIGISILSFGFIRLLPGDPVDVLAGERSMSAARRAELIHAFGLDQPLWKQYLDYVWRALHGDLGTSITNAHSIMGEFLTLFPATVELAVCAMIIAIILGISFGMLAAARRDTWIDQLTMGTALVGYSMPIFWWGLLLIIVFAAGLHWVPVQGRMDLCHLLQADDRLYADRQSAVRPKGGFSVRRPASHPAVHRPGDHSARGHRPADALSHARGAQRRLCAHRAGQGPVEHPCHCVHAFRNALIPVVTTIGLQVGTLLAGAVLTETIFSWPGIGKWMIDAIGHRDYTVVQGGLLVIAVIVMIVNLIVDLLYAFINPRIRVQ